MNIARTIWTVRKNNIGVNLYKNFRSSSVNYESTQASQPQVKEEKFDFEDLKVIERAERRKARIEPFMKNVFVSVFNRDLLAFYEILNKEESEALDQRVSTLEKVFSDSTKTREERKNALKRTNLYAAPVGLTNGGLAANQTESIRYLETISSDLQLSQEISDHWVSLEALKSGLKSDQYQGIIDDLSSGDRTVGLCIKESIAERLTQADFRTQAELDGQGVWRVSGEKICYNKDGYLLVLSTLEASRLQAFLVHPGAQGVSSEGNYVSFKMTPATPLEEISEAQLAKTLALSRLHAATLSRCHLNRAINACAEYVKTKVLSGKPLSDLPVIRHTLGEAIMYAYASESAEYFTAGLADGHLEPDAELEMAMCRHFMANHSVTKLLKLIDIPSLDMKTECDSLLYDMRHITSRGESLDSVDMFIALNGLHHAGTVMSEEIKQMRNPLFNPTFIFKKVIANRLQEKDDPKLTLHLYEHLHPTLKIPSEHLEYCVLRMRYACETLMSRHGADVIASHIELKRLAEAATEILVMTAVLARASRSYCIGLRNAEIEMKFAACYVEQTKDRVRKLIKEIDDGEYLNLDHFKVQFGRKLFEAAVVEKPTARVFW